MTNETPSFKTDSGDIFEGKHRSIDKEQPSHELALSEISDHGDSMEGTSEEQDKNGDGDPIMAEIAEELRQ